MTRKSVAVLALAVALFAVPAPASAQLHIGPQVSLAEDADLGVGGRVAVYDLGDAEALQNWEGVGSVDVFFPGGDVSYWEVNLNGLYNFSLGRAAPLFPYVGGGLNVARTSVDGGDSDSDIGLNVLAGWKYEEPESLTPFAEVRLELGGGEQLVVTGGLLFP